MGFEEISRALLAHDRVCCSGCRDRPEGLTVRTENKGRTEGNDEREHPEHATIASRDENRTKGPMLRTGREVTMEGTEGENRKLLGRESKFCDTLLYLCKSCMPNLASLQ